MKTRLTQSPESRRIRKLIEKAVRQARREMAEQPDRPKAFTGGPVKWPVDCTVGPGLEGAIACETKIGYVNGSDGTLIYRGYDVFDLCIESTFEEVCFLLLYGDLPTAGELDAFKAKLIQYRHLPNTMRLLLASPADQMHPMAALRLGVTLMRRRLTWRDQESGEPDADSAIASDEDSIPMETADIGEAKADFEFKSWPGARPDDARKVTDNAAGAQSCLRLIAGMGPLTAAIARIRKEKLPIDPHPELSLAGNFLYQLRGEIPTAAEEKMLDVALILHADHGMNASTFASMVVASTMADIYSSIAAGIGVLSGPLHGGANEAVLDQLAEIGGEDRVVGWMEKAVERKKKVMGFGHRVYKTYDPRARVLQPLAEHVAAGNPETATLYRTAVRLEQAVSETLGKNKPIFPNVDFYSGILYRGMGIPADLFTPIFAVSRVAGWSARVLEYLKNNRIFRPRAVYTGPLDLQYRPLGERQ